MLSHEEIRKKSAKSAKEDLTKGIEHLLIDVHEELLQTNRPGSTSQANRHLENMVHAQKRLASLIVKNAITSGELAAKNLELQSNIDGLTRQLRKYTIILMIIGIISISPILINGIRLVYQLDFSLFSIFFNILVKLGL